MANINATAAGKVSGRRKALSERGRMTTVVIVALFISCIIFAVADQSPEWLREGALWAALAVGALGWALDIPAAVRYIIKHPADV